MQRGKMHPDWMQCIPCSMKKWNPMECSGFYTAWLNAVDSCSMIECIVFSAAWAKASRFNAVDFLQHVPKHPDWMQRIPCSVIECWEFHSLWRNGSRLCAVESMQRGPMHLDWMQWILCSMIECSGFLQHEWMQWIFCSMAQSIPI